MITDRKRVGLTILSVLGTIVVIGIGINEPITSIAEVILLIATLILTGILSWQFWGTFMPEK